MSQVISKVDMLIVEMILDFLGCNEWLHLVEYPINHGALKIIFINCISSLLTQSTYKQICASKIQSFVQRESQIWASWVLIGRESNSLVKFRSTSRPLCEHIYNNICLCIMQKSIYKVHVIAIFANMSPSARENFGHSRSRSQ